MDCDEGISSLLFFFPRLHCHCVFAALARKEKKVGIQLQLYSTMLKRNRPYHHPTCTRTGTEERFAAEGEKKKLVLAIAIPETEPDSNTFPRASSSTSCQRARHEVNEGHEEDESINNSMRRNGDCTNLKFPLRNRAIPLAGYQAELRFHGPSSKPYRFPRDSFGAALLCVYRVENGHYGGGHAWSWPYCSGQLSNATLQITS